MDDPNMTMEEYIKFEEEKARRRAIVIDDTFAAQDTLMCKSQVSTLVKDKIDFRISFNESDDEDYTIICDKNSFSYKMISVNDLKTDSENNNEKFIPSIPSPEPAISCFDDLDFFNDFENEFPAIVYNDAQTSKSDLLTEPVLSPQHIDEFNLNDETSVSEYDEDEQNILYFNDIFPFNIIRPDDLNLEKDNNDNDIDIIQSSEGNEITHRSNTLMHTSSDKIDKIFDEESFVLELNVNIVTWIYLFNGMLLCFIINLKIGLQEWIWRIRLKPIRHMAIPLREQRHPFLRYEGLQYTEADIEDFKTRLTRIYMKEVYMVQVFDFGGLPNLMAGGLSARMLIEHRDAQGIGISSVGDFLSITPSYTTIWDPILRLCHRLIACSIAGRSQTLEKVTVTDLFYLRGIDIGSDNVPYLLARYLRLFAARRKSGAHISGGQFVARLAKHFRLLTAEILGGLTVAWDTRGAADDAAGGLPRSHWGCVLPLSEEPQGRAGYHRGWVIYIDTRESRGCVVDDGLVRRLKCIGTWARIGSRSRYLRLFAARRKSGAHISGGQFVARLAKHFRLLTAEILGGLTVAMGPERQPDAAAGAPAVTEDAPAVDEGDQIQYMGCHWPRTDDGQGRRHFDLFVYDSYKIGSKFNTIVHENEMKPSRIFTLNARMGKRDDFRCVEAEEKSNLKTSL
ncbi:hypothetical protein Tco_1226603 [Tanacetum coccineum]